MVKADWKRWNFRRHLKVDRMLIERMCAGREFQIEGAECRHRKGPRGKVASNTGWSGKEDTYWKNARIWTEDSVK